MGYGEVYQFQCRLRATEEQERKGSNFNLMITAKSQAKAVYRRCPEVGGSRHSRRLTRACVASDSACSKKQRRLFFFFFFVNTHTQDTTREHNKNLTFTKLWQRPARIQQPLQKPAANTVQRRPTKVLCQGFLSCPLLLLRELVAGEAGLHQRRWDGFGKEFPSQAQNALLHYFRLKPNFLKN